MKYHRLGYLKSRNLCLIALEIGKSKIKVSASFFFFFFFGKSSLPGLQMVTFSVYVHGETESKQTLQDLFL